ncbi:hypothetical protein KKH56_05255 [bacterium]|nr:hypothetical protein [bacterium]
MKKEAEFPVVGRLVECGKCKRKILVEYALIGVDHCLGVVATCWGCLYKDVQNKAVEAYKLKIENE